MPKAELLIGKYGNKADSKGKFPQYGKKEEIAANRIKVQNLHRGISISGKCVR